MLSEAKNLPCESGKQVPRAENLCPRNDREYMANVNRKLVVWFAAIVVAVNGFFPAVWILLTSFKTETELIQSPITYLPQAATLTNYDSAFTSQPILRFMFNSLVVASLSTVVCVLVGALAA